MVFGNIPHVNSGGHKRRLKRKAAAYHESHKVVAPIKAGVLAFLDKLSVFPDSIFGNVLRNVAVGGGTVKKPVSFVANFQERARLRIALAKKQKVVGVFFGQNAKIGLRPTVAHAGSLPSDFSFAYKPANFQRT